jgi:uncharacterized protein (TIGR03435 family)
MSHLGRKLLLAARTAVLITPIIVTVIGASTICAQSQPATPQAFAVASVKPNKTADMRSMRMNFLPGGRFTATNLPLRLIIVTAYNLPFQSMRLSGGPDWINSERFDIDAKADEGAVPAGLSDKERNNRIRMMLQALLADRFKLTIRRESKDLTMYALVVAKNGPKLQKASIEEKDCPEAPTNGVSCHSFMGGQGRGLHGKAVNMTDLVLFIENWTDHPVVDKSGIEGLYEIDTVGWIPMRGNPPPAAPAPAAPTGAPPTAPAMVAAPTGEGDMSDPTRPTLFAVLEKLGLGLKQQKGPVDMFVIESVERPVEN